MAAPILFRVRLPARTFETSSAALTVGTVSSCSIALRDPVASEEHCRVSWAQGSFLVEDLGSATGTYLNGFPVEGRAPLRKDDVLVVGVSRLRIEAVGTSAAPLLEVGVEEAAFHYTASGAGGAKRDADNWVRWEVGFGRLKGLRAAGWVASALALVGLASPWLRPAEEVVLSAGALRERHALLFDNELQEFERNPDLGHLADEARIAAREGCASCHDSFRGTPMSKCTTCHREKVSTQHPFKPAPIAANELAAGWNEDHCVACHSEHKGPGHENGPMNPGKASETCLACHSEEQRALALERFWDKIDDGESGPDVETRSSPLTAPEFSHRVHLTGTRLGCTDCHVPAESAAGGHEYAPVRFERCMHCHDQRGDPDPRVAARSRFDVPLHGTDGDGKLCKGCHEQPKEAALRKVETAAEELEFLITRRPHGDVFKERTTQCTECHLDGPPPIAGQQAKLRFQHGLHLAELEPASSSPEDKKRASEDCATCHAKQAEAETFFEDKRKMVADLDEACGKCHLDDDGKPLSIKFVTRDREDRPARVAFSHATHAAVPGSCFTCHTFEASDDPFHARPTTRASVTSCVECHDRSHRDLGGGVCARCHEPAPDGGAPPVYSGVLERRERPNVLGFSHFTPGHEEASDSEQSCRTCHPGIEQAQDTRTVPILGESSRVCVVCHIQKGAKFHFQLPAR